jgi:putative flippase GtrA
MKTHAFVRFLLVGLLNTAVGYAVILGLQYGIGMDRRLANVGGYLIGGMVSYVLNRRYTFASERAHAQALPRFALAALACFGLNLAVLEFASGVLALPGAVAQALAIGSYTVAFYAVSRCQVFRA